MSDWIYRTRLEAWAAAEPGAKIELHAIGGTWAVTVTVEPTSYNSIVVTGGPSSPGGQGIERTCQDAINRLREAGIVVPD